MSIIFNQITEISDAKGNVLIKYPIGTLLDRITDVWPIIIEYYHHFRPFAIGLHSDSYLNHRLITHDECNTKTFTQLFGAYYGKSYYKKRKGIHALVTNNIRRKYLCSDIGHLVINGQFLFVYEHEGILIDTY